MYRRHLIPVSGENEYPYLSRTARLVFLTYNVQALPVPRCSLQQSELSLLNVKSAQKTTRVIIATVGNLREKMQHYIVVHSRASWQGVVFHSRDASAGLPTVINRCNVVREYRDEIELASRYSVAVHLTAFGYMLSVTWIVVPPFNAKKLQHELPPKYT